MNEHEETEIGQSGDWRSGEKKSRSGDRRSGGVRRGWFSRGYLPHFDGGAGVVQHVTVHLYDSLPKSAIERIHRETTELPDDELNVERQRRLHEWMDAGYGSCILRRPAIAEIVQGALQYFDGTRYHLHAWVVMPNHFHVLVQTVDEWTLAKIVASWKKFTGRRIKDYLREDGNAGILIGSTGKKVRANREIGDPGEGNYLLIDISKPVWHPEYWDRYIRNENHYARVRHYINTNPVMAGLVERPELWSWSSARVTS